MDQRPTCTSSGAIGVLTEHITARGHEHVTATHESTIEVTTDDWLTPAGDCIVAIGADRAPASFDPSFQRAASSAAATVTMILQVAGHEHRIHGRGDPDLTFASDRCLIARTSGYVDDRTVLVEATGAAASVDRPVVAALAAGASLHVTLRVES